MVDVSEFRRSWADGSEEWMKRVAGEPSTASPSPGAPFIAPSEAAAQKEMTHVSWDVTEIDLDRIHRVGMEKARHRFRAAIPALIWNAAALEGNTFTLPEVRTLLDGVTVSGKRVEEELQIIALSEGYSLIDELVGAGRFRLDKATSDQVHGLVARHEAIESGHFRGEGDASGGGGVRLSNGGFVEGVPEQELPARWDNLVEYLAEVDDSRLRALVYNAAATRTQFYFDGNKRTARLMMTGELMTHGYDSVNVPHARRLEYNIALDELFTTDDATPLMRFTASCGLPR